MKTHFLISRSQDFVNWKQEEVCESQDTYIEILLLNQRFIKQNKSFSPNVSAMKQEFESNSS